MTDRIDDQHYDKAAACASDAQAAAFEAHRREPLEKDLASAGIRTAITKAQAATSTAIDHGCELLPTSQPYFIVGLSGGKTDQDGSTSLPLDILRYIDYLHQHQGQIVLFDAPALLNSIDRSWQPAAQEMTAKLRNIEQALYPSDTPLPIINASELISGNLSKFDTILSEVKTIVSCHPEIVKKIWQIVPPSAKKSAGVANDTPYEKLDTRDQEKAFKLMEYEILHLAFIIFAPGEKIRHGRSEERSAQAIKMIRATPEYSKILQELDSNGQITEPIATKGARIQAYAYPNPYKTIDAHDLLTVGAVVESGQIPLRYSLTMGEALCELVRQGKQEEIVRYLTANISDASIKTQIATWTHWDKTGVHELATLVSTNIIWPIEKTELIELKKSNPLKYQQKLKIKVLELQTSLSLLPTLSILVQEIMPLYYTSAPDIQDPESYIGWLAEGLSDPYLQTILHLQEYSTLQHLYSTITDLAQIADKPVTKKTNWSQTMIEIDIRFNNKNLTEALAQSKQDIAFDETGRAQAVKDLQEVTLGSKLAGKAQACYTLMFWGLRGIGDIYPPASDEVIRFVLISIIVPYLEKNSQNGWLLSIIRYFREHPDATRFLARNGHDLIDEYVKLREKELGIELADRMEATSDAYKVLGLTQIPSFRRIADTSREMAAFARDTHARFPKGHFDKDPKNTSS